MHHHIGVTEREISAVEEQILAANESISSTSPRVPAATEPPPSRPPPGQLNEVAEQDVPKTSTPNSKVDSGINSTTEEGSSPGNISAIDNPSGILSQRSSGSETGTRPKTTKRVAIRVADSHIDDSRSGDEDAPLLSGALQLRLKRASSFYSARDSVSAADSSAPSTAASSVPSTSAETSAVSSAENSAVSSAAQKDSASSAGEIVTTSPSSTSATSATSGDSSSSSIASALARCYRQGNPDGRLTTAQRQDVALCRAYCQMFGPPGSRPPCAECQAERACDTGRVDI